MSFSEQTTACPQCGAPALFRGTTVSRVCEYCGSTLIRDAQSVHLVGKVSALLETGSPILLHSRGAFEKIPFEITGRLQIRYERGTWNEWYVEFANRTFGWLADAQGHYSMMREVRAAVALPPFAGILPGRTRISVMDRTFVATDKRGASYQGAEGELPFAAAPGTLFYACDFRGFAGEFLTLDYGDSPHTQSPIMYAGRAVRLLDLGLQPMRVYEGWPRA